MNYIAKKNGQDTYDICALDEEGRILACVPDVTDNQAYAQNAAWVFTQNHMPPAQLQEVVEHLIGVVL